MGLDLCYEELILIFHIAKIALFFTFEVQKMVFHSLDLNPSVLGNHDSAPKDFFPDSTNKSTPAKAYSSKNVSFFFKKMFL